MRRQIRRLSLPCRRRCLPPPLPSALPQRRIPLLRHAVGDVRLSDLPRARLQWWCELGRQRHAERRVRPFIAPPPFSRQPFIAQPPTSRSAISDPLNLLPPQRPNAGKKKPARYLETNISSCFNSSYQQVSPAFFLQPEPMDGADAPGVVHAMDAEFRHVDAAPLPGPRLTGPLAATPPVRRRKLSPPPPLPKSLPNAAVATKIPRYLETNRAFLPALVLQINKSCCFSTADGCRRKFRRGPCDVGGWRISSAAWQRS